ncbi:hypothetical protein HETIRDRAFT_439507 [Heterobasidion irregulare TC 32-1]|uniref:Uncharacterized protein n=1 Tax=Heterobasidion irregulare (strain TC 32-1) TaxID=747525 RepID=W4KC05_HETIT|nr:uncharacterized protein HETIRDRAFT_439507 [Heterobasidion irregulare TC 32-1]ETW82865.1 hypothetical protein HETIRDRAFT_439507 [Heterobasidion irregulare TC 32-1]
MTLTVLYYRFRTVEARVCRLASSLSATNSFILHLIASCALSSILLSVAVCRFPAPSRSTRPVSSFFPSSVCPSRTLALHLDLLPLHLPGHL